MSNIVEEESDVTAALRAELEEELRNKKQCTYPSYECTQLCLEGYKFCAKHILQDKNAPFKQCSYVFSSNGKRCHLPAPRSDKKDYGYCNEHALRATLARNKQNSKNQPPRTAEVLLNSLSHYVKKPKNQIASTSYSEDDHLINDEKIDQKTSKYNDPFVDLESSNIYNDHCNEVLDYNSESESDIEPSTLISIWHDAHIDSSDDESIDSEQEDPLKHANVYTAEEVTAIIRDKLIKLQSLYVEQYRHLQYLLKEKRRKYLHALKREKETCCNIYNQVRDNPKEQRLYKKLKSLNNYQKSHGSDAILNKRLKDLRAKTNDATTSKPHPSVKCIFTQGGVKCGEKTLPLTKYCKKHILEDPNQILFRACGKMNGDVECTTPIAAIFDSSTCQLHMDIPSLKSYNQIRKDSESDMDDSAEPINTSYSADNFTDNIKHEFVPYDIPPELPKMETLPSLLFEENSQSLSESTISQNEIFNMPDPSLNFSTTNILDVKEERQNQMGFYQISESCTIVPNTSDLVAINTSSSNEQEIRTWNARPIPLKNEPSTISDKSFLATVSQTIDKTTESSHPLTNQLENNDHLLKSSRIVNQDTKNNQNETEQISQEIYVFNEDNIPKEHNKNIPDGKPQVSEEISEIGIIDMEIETGGISEDDKCGSHILEDQLVGENQQIVEDQQFLEDQQIMEDQQIVEDKQCVEDQQTLEEQNIGGVCDMEVCTDDVLNTIDVERSTSELDKEIVLDCVADTLLSSQAKE